MATIKIKKINSKAKIPRVATDGSACFDLAVCEEVAVSRGAMVRAKTGLIFEIPPGYHVEVYSRSNIAGRGIIIPNSPGIIDSDYRGEIVVMLYGLACKWEYFGVGSRVAQARLVRNEPTKIKVVSRLSDTERGSGGFGSTGK